MHAGRATGSPGGCCSSAGSSSPRPCTGTTAERTPASGRCSSSAAREEDRETLEAMEAEHAEFEPLLEACEQGFARLAEHADDDARAALAVRLSATRECLARHLEHEETGAIPIIQRVLTQEDWERLDEEHFKEDLTPAKVVRVVPWAAYGVPRDVLDDVFAKTGLRLQAGLAGHPRSVRAAGGARLPAPGLRALRSRASRVAPPATPRRAGPPTRHTTGQHRPRAGWRGPVRPSRGPPSPGRCRPDR